MSHLSFAVLTPILLQFQVAEAQGFKLPVQKQLMPSPTKFECPVHNSAIVKRLNCSESGFPLLSANLVFHRNIKRATANIKLFYEKNARMTPLFATEIDYCVEMSKSNPNFLIQYMLKEFLNKDSRPPRCPMKKNFEYYVHNFNMSRLNVPYTGIGKNWLVSVPVRLDGKKSFSLNLYGTLHEV